MASYSKNSRKSATGAGRGRPATGAILAALLLALPWHTVAAADPGVREALRLEIGRLLQPIPADAATDLQGQAIAAPRLVAEFYEARNFAPAWLEPARAVELLGVIRASDRDGLRPADYRPQFVERLLGRDVSPGEAPAGPAAARDLARRDIMLTDALALLAAHLRYGKANPEAPLAAANPGAQSSAGSRHLAPLAADLQGIARADSLAVALASARPRSAHYHRLLAGLAKYRHLAAAGGWPAVSSGPSLRPGMSDSRVRELARRLAATGDLVDPGWEQASPDDVYGERLQSAVGRFQARHGLATDSIVGPATLAALNASVAARIDQLRVNLERVRWIADRLGGDYLLVNAASFRADLVRDGRLAWQTRVVVGEREQQTPEVCSMLKYVVFNPTWTLPHRIARDEILPRIRKDPQFFASGGYELYDRDGTILDPANVDWAAVTEESFRFTLMQLPGPANQLGQVKFVFPNEYSVTMHDTPARHLFDVAERAFSHGCVRVDEPLALAANVLSADGWTRAHVDAQVRSNETRTVFLSEPLPVLLLYFTAEVDDAGTVHFYDDIYERDAAVLKLLDADAR